MKSKATIVIAGVLVAAIGAGIWWYFLRGPGDLSGRTEAIPDEAEADLRPVTSGEHDWPCWGGARHDNRSDVTGSGRKLFRQKGTGRARRGDIKSPLLRGGGVVFGPDGRNYAFKAPKKVRRLALKMALSSKLQENELLILDRFLI